MKRFLGLLGLLTILTFGFTSNAVAQDVTYKRVDVYSNGANIVDVVLSFDRNRTCVNNFSLVNNTQYYMTYNFSIKMGGVVMYTGRFTMRPYGYVYFNDAFVNCDSSIQSCEVILW